MWLDETRRNLRYAVRSFARTPSFTLTAILTLALTIGANTAIFSVVDAVLLRPLPYPDPDRLAAVGTLVEGRGVRDTSYSEDGRTFFQLRDHGSATFSIAATSGGFTGVNLVAGFRAEYVQQQRVSTGFFHLIGVPPQIGREFDAGEDREAGPAAVILSDGLWRRLFAADRSVVGKTVMLRGEAATIVGVMPPGFQGLFRADLWTPLRPSTTGEGSGDNYFVIARLRSDVSWPEAVARAAAIGAPALASPAVPSDIHRQVTLAPLQQGASNDLRRPLLVLWGAVGVVLLIGCANVAGLLLARGATRTRELATRAALVAGSAAVVRQLLTESVVLALAGSVAGMAVGAAVTRLLASLSAQQFDIWQDIRLDARVLAMTAVVAIATALVFGLYPALRAARFDARTGLSEGSRAIAGSRSQWPRRLLVAIEVALGIVLVVGAGLLTRTFLHLRQLEPGFDANHVVAASVSLQDARYATTASMARLFDDTLRRIRAIPGVESAGVGLHVPYERWLNINMHRTDGPDADSHLSNLNYVTAGYFTALRVPLLAGRAPTDADTADSPHVALVNRAFSERYFKGENPIGHGLRIGDNSMFQIVGIVGDVQQRSGWGGFGPIGPAPAVYVPASQLPDGFTFVHTWFSPSWVVRTSGDVPVAREVAQAIAAVDAMMPVAAFHSMDELRDLTLGAERLQALLLGLLASLALVLAAVGIGGLIATSVAERRREMGIRLALGSTGGRAVLTAALPGGVMTMAGLGAGLVLARVGVHVLDSLIYGVAATDIVTFASAAALLVAVGGAASLVPALRLLKMDPVEALRDGG